MSTPHPELGFNATSYLTTITHPRLTKQHKKATLAFVAAWDQYTDQVRDAGKDPVPIKSAIDANVLRALIFTRAFGKDVTKQENVTDNHIKVYLDKVANRGSQVFTITALEKVMNSSLRMNMTEDDVTCRIQTFFGDFINLIHKYGWENALEKEPTAINNLLLANIKPSMLRNKISSDLALDKSSLLSSVNVFVEYVLEQAVIFEPFHVAALQHSPSEYCKSTYQKSAHERVSQESQHAKHSTNKENTPENSKRLPPFCLNPIHRALGIRHFMIPDCDITSTEEAERLIAKAKREAQERRSKSEKLKERRQDKTSSVKKEVKVEEEDEKRLKILSTSSTSDNGRIHGKINNKLSVIVNGDYGADHSAISDSIVQKLEQMGSKVSRDVLPSPMKLKLAVKTANGADIHANAHYKVKLTTTLFLRTGPLRLRNIEFLVLSSQMDEVLLSRPVLQSMGFDLQDYLSKFRTTFQDADFSNIGFSKGEPKLHKVLEKSLSSLLMENGDYALDDITIHDLGKSALDSLPEPKDVTIGKSNMAEVHEDLKRMINEAVQNGLPQENVQRLRDIIFEHEDIFRNKMGADPPSSVPPMIIKLKPGAKPIRAKVRRYSPHQFKFLKKKISELENLGLVYKNNQSRWASAPVVVPKPKSLEEWRLTFDLQAVNQLTEQYVWPMPDFETVLPSLQRSEYFALLDFCHGYWQFLLDQASRECQSIITPWAVYTPTRVPQGQTNSVAYMQSSLSMILSKKIQENLLRWIDDMLLHASTIEELLDIIEEFFQTCKRYGLKLHSKKCALFLTSVKWCGRIIDKEGVRFDPARFKGLVEMSAPTKAAELQQFLCACNWVRSSIPEYTQRVAPLAELLELMYAKAGKRTKKAMKNIDLRPQWSEFHEKAFEDIKGSILNACKLAHPSEDKTLCLFTDASELHWASVLTQIPKEDEDLSFEMQRHEPLSFISGSFTGSELNWATPDKEAFAIVQSCFRLDYMLMRPGGFLLFTDHNNLIYIFNPISINPNLSKHSINRVERWAIRMAEFKYQIIHIPGKDNVWADLLSRWGSQKKQIEAYPQLSALFCAPISTQDVQDFEWPSRKKIKHEQTIAVEDGNNPPKSFTKHGDIYKSSTGVIWIPEHARSIQLSIMIVAHCGRGGHRGITTTIESIKPHFHWNTMETDVKVFCNTCLHCQSTIGGNRIPRPLSHALHATKANELIHFDFLYLGPDKGGMKYLLIIKDDLSSFCRLYPTSDLTGTTAASCLLDWFSTYGVVQSWVSDQGPHFKNELMSELNKQLRAFHHFTTPYCPQSNGTVEVVCKEVLRAIRALLSELRVKHDEWMSVLPLVQSILNHAPRPSLNGKAPITAFTGLPADNPLRTVLSPDDSTPLTTEKIRTEKIMNIDALAQAVDQIHKDVAEQKTRKRDQEVQRHNRKTNVKSVDFEIGDFVLVSDLESKHPNKLRVKWKGPYRITRAANPNIFEIEDILAGKRELAHSSRIKRFRDKDMEVSESLKETVAHNNPHHYETITKMMDLRFNEQEHRYEIQCKWRGFSDEEPSWEPYDVIHEDVPDMLDKFLSSHPDQDIVAKAKACSA